MVERHLPIPHRFVCLSDVSVGEVERIPLRHRYPGWWSKVELWRNNIFPDGERILYSDLDVVITGDLSEIAARPERLIVKGDTYRRPPRRPRIGYQSSIMEWTSGQFGKVYSVFAQNPQYFMARFQKTGDQGWLEEAAPGAVFWEHLLPKQIVSFKVDCRHGLPSGARVVDFHGKYMKPWNCHQRWACQALATC